MESKRTFITTLIILVAVVAGIWWFSTRDEAGLVDDGNTTNDNLMMDEALVRDIDVQVLVSPLRVNIMATGDLPDACTTITQAAQARTDRQIEVTLMTKRDRAAVCAEVLTPFTETIALNTTGLTAGTYTVTVNGVREVFTLTDTTVGANTSVNGTFPAGFGDKL